MVSTLVGETINSRRFCNSQTFIELKELKMVYLDMIMGMDWLAFSYANIKCRTKIF